MVFLIRVVEYNFVFSPECETMKTAKVRFGQDFHLADHRTQISADCFGVEMYLVESVKPIVENCKQH